MRGNHTLTFLSLSPSLPLSLKINKNNIFKKLKLVIFSLKIWVKTWVHSIYGSALYMAKYSMLYPCSQRCPMRTWKLINSTLLKKRTWQKVQKGLLLNFCSTSINYFLISFLKLKYLILGQCNYQKTTIHTHTHTPSCTRSLGYSRVIGGWRLKIQVSGLFFERIPIHGILEQPQESVFQWTAKWFQCVVLRTWLP